MSYEVRPPYYPYSEESKKMLGDSDASLRTLPLIHAFERYKYMEYQPVQGIICIGDREVQQ